MIRDRIRLFSNIKRNNLKGRERGTGRDETSGRDKVILRQVQGSNKGCCSFSGRDRTGTGTTEGRRTRWDGGRYCTVWGKRSHGKRNSSKNEKGEVNFTLTYPLRLPVMHATSSSLPSSDISQEGEMTREEAFPNGVKFKFMLEAGRWFHSTTSHVMAGF